MSRLIYITDLHGHRDAYWLAFEVARAEKADAIINGGDMLPKKSTPGVHRTGSMLEAQQEFMEGFFLEFLGACQTANILFYGMFGNDDLRCLHPRWLELVTRNPCVFDLADRWLTLPSGHFIRGCGFVPDYPFGLKDWVLRDVPMAPPMPQLGPPVISTASGYEPIKNLAAFLDSRPTLETALESLVDPAVPPDRAILVIHAPPRGLGLATLTSGVDIGSKAVRAWIECHQPMLTLHGHIHESPDAEFHYRGFLRHTSPLGRTQCHQPGQRLPKELTLSVIELGEELVIETRYLRPARILR